MSLKIGSVWKLKNSSISTRITVTKTYKKNVYYKFSSPGHTEDEYFTIIEYFLRDAELLKLSAISEKIRKIKDNL